MLFNKAGTHIFCFMSLALSTGCANLVTSAVESTVVFIVAKHDEVVEKKQRKYTALDRCIVRGDPEAYALGDAIAYGQPITAKFNIILSRTGEGKENIQPHQLAYAFYVIADAIRDSRAKQRMEWMEKSMKPEDIREIRSIINDKFLTSNLAKCFSVPESYKVAKTPRQLIFEDRYIDKFGS